MLHLRSKPSCCGCCCTRPCWGCQLHIIPITTVAEGFWSRCCCCCSPATKPCCWRPQRRALLLLQVSCCMLRCGRAAAAACQTGYAVGVQGPRQEDGCNHAPLAVQLATAGPCKPAQQEEISRSSTAEHSSRSAQLNTAWHSMARHSTAGGTPLVASRWNLPLTPCGSPRWCFYLFAPLVLYATLVVANVPACSFPISYTCHHDRLLSPGHTISGGHTKVHVNSTTLHTLGH